MNSMIPLAYLILNGPYKKKGQQCSSESTATSQVVSLLFPLLANLRPLNSWSCPFTTQFQLKMHYFSPLLTKSKVENNSVGDINTGAWINYAKSDLHCLSPDRQSSILHALLPQLHIKLHALEVFYNNSQTTFLISIRRYLSLQQMHIIFFSLCSYMYCSKVYLHQLPLQFISLISITTSNPIKVYI